jgi:N-acetylmuramoyl-L-alanine amidase
MNSFIRVIAALALTVWLALSGGVRADGLSALASFDPAGSAITDQGAGFDPMMTPTISVLLNLSQPVPYRISTMNNPPRLVLDFREVDWRALDAAKLSSSRHVTAVRAGLLQAGWSRMVIELDGPYAVEQAEMETRNLRGRAAVRLALQPVSAATFAATAGKTDTSLWALPAPAAAPVGPPKKRQTGTAPLLVVLDPGHGGIDPGSINGDVHEADITLSFARQLKEVLVRQGVQVILTRAADEFVPLETRLSIARAAGADLFLSIHADAESAREATGATVYTLSDGATDKASAELAARHDRDDILSGVDLSNADDQIATVLMDMARTETQPRSDRFAAALVTAIRAAGVQMHKRPHQMAAFSVLKSPDVPSALLELGFLSSDGDLKNLQDPGWRARMAAAVGQAIAAWAKADAADAALIRQ